MSIPEDPKKIKLVILPSLLAVLALLFVFGVLESVAESAKKEPLRFVFNPENSATVRGSLLKPLGETSGMVVASKSGTRYHLPSCPGAKSISKKNKITFSSIAEAEAAGYKPALNCKGLKK